MNPKLWRRIKNPKDLGIRTTNPITNSYNIEALLDARILYSFFAVVTSQNIQSELGWVFYCDH